MAEITNKEAVEVNKPQPKVEAVNAKNNGDVLVLVESDRLEHGGIGFTKGQHAWMPSDAAQFHAAAGSVKRIA